MKRKSDHVVSQNVIQEFQKKGIYDYLLHYNNLSFQFPDKI
jgi:hypothetical protein